MTDDAFWRAESVRRGEALRRALDSRGIDYSGAAKWIGISSKTLTRWMNGDSSADAVRLMALAARLECTVDELLGDQATPAMRRVPIFNLTAAAGAGVFPDDFEELGYLTFPEPQLRQIGQPNELALANIEGESMEPDLFDGELVMFNHAQRNEKDGLVIARTDQGVVIKRLQNIGTDTIQLVSSNKAYPAKILKRGVDDFEVLGRVVRALKRP